MSPPEYDLIVVGSGFAGATAALSFLETRHAANKPNARVALVETGRPDERCGASRWTMAYLRLDRDLAFDGRWKGEMAAASKGQADAAYCDVLAKEARRTAEWLQQRGVRWVHHEERDVLLEWETDQHFVFPEGGGVAVVRRLMELIGRYEREGAAEVLWETEARHVLTDARGAVRGVQARKKDGLLYELRAPDVVLACGGFEGNREMLAKYVGRRTHELPLIAPGLAHNKGAGLNMALELGAATSGSFDGMHCELVDTRTTKPDAVIWGHNYGIVVNEHCKRFYDEGKGHLFSTFEMIALELWRDQNQKGYFVTDDTIMKRFRPGWVYDTTDLEPEKADTIRELAVKLGCDPDELQKTVDDFNEACDKETPFDLMKLDGKRTHGLNPEKTNWANPIVKPPFYGYPLMAHLTFTYGGVKTNTNAQVLSTNDVPIPGLWAAGEMTGLYYNEYPPATSVLRSLTFGRLAGTQIAEKLKKSVSENSKSGVSSLTASNI